MLRCLQVARRLDDGRTALFAFRGSCMTTDWGTNSHVKLAILGNAPELFPWEVIASDASVHEGFLARFRETLGAADSHGLLDQVRRGGMRCAVSDKHEL
jgi:hypothetical protein